MKYYVVDTFTDSLFKGNPAGVCLLDGKISDDRMQSIAFENNLAETAFLLNENGKHILRWFTPKVEIDLCGHATLATAFVLMNYVDSGMKTIDFHTMSGVLTVTREKELYSMDFPSRKPLPAAVPAVLEEALGCKALETHISRDLLVVLENEAAVKNLKPDLKLLCQIENAFAVIVTARGEDCDFVSRFFAPKAGIDEDPVTGSSHSTLIPFWSDRLGKKRLIARQLSERGGLLYCEDAGERVKISGSAVCYLSGNIEL
jgi:PhzF family phenazine biosynthesis protein